MRSKTQHDPHDKNSSPQHYHATPTTTDLHIASKHQMNNTGKKIGKFGAVFASWSQILILEQQKANLDKSDKFTHSLIPY